jgi:hypothetical protein
VKGLKNALKTDSNAFLTDNFLVKTRWFTDIIGQIDLLEGVDAEIK